MEIFPIAQIARAVQQNAAALLVKSRGDAHVPKIAFAPEKRIAETCEARGIGRLLDRGLPFLPGAKVGVSGSCEALDFAEIVNAIAKSGLLGSGCLDAGVKDGDGAVVFDRASGETADGVRPMHVAPNRGIWVVLEKHVVTAAPVDGRVWVVHPVFCGQEMKLWTQ